MLPLQPDFLLEKAAAGDLTGSLAGTAAFVDISGFTALTGSLMTIGREGAEILSGHINRVFDPAIRAVHQHGGFIASFAGDAFSAVFPDEPGPLLRGSPGRGLAAGGPGEEGNGTSALGRSTSGGALRAGELIREQFLRLGPLETPLGPTSLGVKVGLAHGRIDWTILPHPRQHLGWFSGPAVTAAALAEHHCSPGEIVVTDALRVAGAGYRWGSLDGGGFFRLEESGSGKPKRRAGAQVGEAGRRWAGDETLLTRFVPASLAGLGFTGEFRPVIPVFINFQAPADDTARNAWLMRVVELARSQSGWVNLVDFGDKGALLFLLFGAPQALERSAERVAGFLRELRLDSPIAWRAGATRGTVFAGMIGSPARCTYSVLGKAVNLAARLMAKADWGQIWIDDALARELGPRWDLPANPPVSLKGFPAPVASFRLDPGQAAAAPPPPTGSSAGGRGALPCVGRTEELLRMRRSTDPLAQGRQAGTLVLAGPPGIGKTRLLQELHAWSEQQGFCWWELGCDQLQQRSFLPFIRFFEALVGSGPDLDRRARLCRWLDELGTACPDRRQAEAVARAEPFLARLLSLPGESHGEEELSPQVRLENLLDGLKAVIKARASVQPLLLVVEDVQWADADTRACLERSLVNIGAVPLLVVLTARAEPEEATWSPRTGPKPVSIFLEALTPAASAELAGTLAGSPLTPSLQETLWRSTRGNPFYLEQMVRFLLERGRIRLERGRFRLEKGLDELPPSLAAVLLARLDHLERRVVELMKAASVLGQRFSLTVLSRMLDRRVSPEEVRPGLAAGIWSALSDVEVLFRHALIRNTIYEMQLRQALRRLHRRAALSLLQVHAEDHSQVAPDLARHYRLAGMRTQARLWLYRSLRIASADFRNEDALAAARALLDMETLPRRRFPLLRRLAVLLERTGAWEEASLAWKEALGLVDPDRSPRPAAELALAAGILARNRGEIEEAFRLWDSAETWFAAARSRSGCARVRSERALHLGAQARYPEALALLEEERKLASRRRNRDRELFCLTHLGRLANDQGREQEALSFLEKALDLARGLGTPERQIPLLAAIGRIHFQGHRLRQAERFWLDRLDLARRCGVKLEISRGLSDLAGVAYMEGDHGRLVESDGEALAIFEEIGDRLEIARACGNLGVNFQDLGRDEEAEKLYFRQLELSREIGNRIFESNALGFLGSLYLRQQRNAEAVRILEEAVAFDRRYDLGFQLVVHLSDLAEGWWQSGDLAAAQRVNEEGRQLARAGRFGKFVCQTEVMAVRLAWKAGEVLRVVEDRFLSMLGSIATTEVQEACVYYWLARTTGQTRFRSAARGRLQALLAKAWDRDFQAWLDDLPES